jgi:anti-sigma factor RsiW
MPSEDFHPRDEEFLLTADGELSGRRAPRVRAHLASCWDCRARMAEIEETIADFARVYCRHFGPELPPIDGARAQLKTRLAELAGKLRADSWPGFFRFAPAARIAAYLCVTLFTTIVLAGFSSNTRR